MTDPIRITGTLLTIHPSANRHGGSFGEILGDNRKYYVWSAWSVALDTGVLTTLARVTFEPSYPFALHVSTHGVPQPDRSQWSPRPHAPEEQGGHTGPPPPAGSQPE